MPQRGTAAQPSEQRARELRDGLLALRREQGLLVAELVWNEMRAREILAWCDEADAGNRQLPGREYLERDLHRRLELIRSLARWEVDADRAFRRQHARLLALLEADPDLEFRLKRLAEALDPPGLELLARAAAAELGLALAGGVDGC